MSTMEYRDQQKYKNNFDAIAYLKSEMCDVSLLEDEIKYLIQFYNSFQDDSLLILEFSGGASLLDMIPAAKKASKIIFSDFNEQNRDEMKKWLREDREAYDWGPVIKHHLLREGKSGSETEVKERESTLREKIQAVIHCDLASENIVGKEYSGPYDIINCNGVLDSICSTKEQFSEGLKKIAALLKQGGHFILSTDDYDSYFVGEIEFFTPLALSVEEYKEAFAFAGLQVIQYEVYESYSEISFLMIAQRV